MKAIWGVSSKYPDEILEHYFLSINDKHYGRVNLSFWNIIGRVILPNFIIKCFKNTDQYTYESLMYHLNAYLNPSPIIAWHIYANGYDFKFLPDAYFSLDPVEDISGMLGQRKRWINGKNVVLEEISD